MKQKEIKKILKEYADVFNALEEYDKTGKLPKLKEQTGKPISQIIEERI